MRDACPNHYERAFEGWLIDHRVEYLRADEHRRLGTSRESVKNFDFLLCARSGQRLIVEVKGRTFHGTNLADMTGLECWVTLDDVAGLRMWQQALGSDHQAVFVFAYRLANVDVELDGRETLVLDDERYVFFCLPVDDYHPNMKRRSLKWQTVTLPAEAFRRHARELKELLL
jgi:hypothetical protein